MWSRQIISKEIISGIAKAKNFGQLYNETLFIDNCWSINVLYSPFNRNELDGLDVTVEMKYKRGDKAISKVWLKVNGMDWQYWYRSRDPLYSVDKIEVQPILTQDDCSDMNVERFEFTRPVEQKLENLYREYLNSFKLVHRRGVNA